MTVGAEHQTYVDLRIKELLEGARWERPVRISPKQIPAPLLRHAQALYTMNRRYSLGSVPWSRGIPVPRALHAPPPNLSTAMDPRTRRFYS
eukprot:5479690-Lingulodinium_polyedra.AAC.1